MVITSYLNSEGYRATTVVRKFSNLGKPSFSGHKFCLPRTFRPALPRPLPRVVYVVERNNYEGMRSQTAGVKASVPVMSRGVGRGFTYVVDLWRSYFHLLYLKFLFKIYRFYVTVTKKNYTRQSANYPLHLYVDKLISHSRIYICLKYFKIKCRNTMKRGMMDRNPLRK